MLSICFPRFWISFPVFLDGDSGQRWLGGVGEAMCSIQEKHQKFAIFSLGVVAVG